MLQTETTHRAQNEWPHSVCVCTRPSASHSPRHMGQFFSGSEETERTSRGIRATRSLSDSLRSPLVGKMPSPCRRKSPRKVEYKPSLVFVPGSKRRSKDSMTPTSGRPFAPRSQSVDWFGQKTVKRRRKPPPSDSQEHVPRRHMRALPREPLLGDDEVVFAIIHRAHFIRADERERQRFHQIRPALEAAEAVGANISWRRDRFGRGSSVELDNGSLDGERVTAAAAHAVAELHATATERRWQLDRQACGRMRGNAPGGMPAPPVDARTPCPSDCPSLGRASGMETGRAFNFTAPRSYCRKSQMNARCPDGWRCRAGSRAAAHARPCREAAQAA